MVRINGIKNLLINGGLIGVITHLLTIAIDPNFLGRPRELLVIYYGLVMLGRVNSKTLPSFHSQSTWAPMVQGGPHDE